jgi:hypothetical protein
MTGKNITKLSTQRIKYTSRDIQLIEVNPNPLRPVDEAEVKRLAASMQRIGLMTPVTVRLIEDEYSDRWVMVAGRHRLAAAKSLGWKRIDIIEVDWTDTEARLWEISENLHRADLTQLQRKEQIAEWIRLTDEKNNSGRTPATIPRGPGMPEGGLRAAAREIGIKRTSAQEAIKVASLSDEAKAAAVKNGLDDNTKALLEAAKETKPQDQIAKIVELANRKPAKRAERAVRKPGGGGTVSNSLTFTLKEEWREPMARTEKYLGVPAAEYVDFLLRLGEAAFNRKFQKGLTNQIEWWLVEMHSKYPNTFNVGSWEGSCGRLSIDKLRAKYSATPEVA